MGMAKSISIDSLVADGLYEWDKNKPVDDMGRHYLCRTPKGDRALAFWSGEDLKALGSLLNLASTTK